jgi:RNA polymerase sigma-70 factor (ECF subfamily)
VVTNRRKKEDHIMSMVESRQVTAEDDAVVTAARAGDESAFTAVAEGYRRQLHAHCYRMLGSFHDSEDVVQETLLKAWRNRESFAGRSSFRAWLYRIATNACLDFLAHSRRRVVREVNDSADSRSTPPPHIAWLQPYPDRLLEQVAPREAEPDAVLIAKETLELAFLVALQFLPPKQRAVLILRDVLDWSAKEAADLLHVSVASVNGALQRARATLNEHRRPRNIGWAPGIDTDEHVRALVQRYVDATERNDPDAIAEMLREDVRCSMPPHPATWAGRDAVLEAWIEGGFGSESLGQFKCVITRANGMPAVACYLREPGGAEYRPMAVDVLEIEDGVITEITTFPLEPMLEAFGLPAAL